MRKKGMLLLLASSLLMGGLTGCGFFGDGGDYALSSYETSYDSSTGNTTIIFYFTDEDRDPFTVTIPAGAAGKDGVSVSSATVTDNEDDHSYTINIAFSDDSIDPIVLTIPYYEGVSVTGVTVDKDEEGNTTIQFTYSDGTTSQMITIPSGNGIKSIIATPNSNGYHLVIEFTDSGVEPVEFDIENGKGIDSISVDLEKQTTTQYCLTITYSDGTFEDVMFDKPETTKWLYGSINPTSDNTEGSNDGDFYLNMSSGWVFLKLNGNWQPLFCMKADEEGEEEYCRITFNPNGGHWEGTDDSNNAFMNMVVGKTMSLNVIPIPEYENHIFKGWYTNPDNPNSGQFTDLTIITGNLTLLAKWEAIA